MNEIYKLIFMQLEASLASFLHLRHFPSDEDSDIEDENQEVDSEDLEKFNASCAAFTVVCLVCLFVSEFLLMSVYLVLFNGELSWYHQTSAQTSFYVPSKPSHLIFLLESSEIIKIRI